MKNKTVSANTIVALNTATFDTILYLVNCIREKVKETEEGFPEAAITLSLCPIKNFCNYIENEIDKAVNFYGFKKEE